jgi:hypothetical protein
MTLGTDRPRRSRLSPSGTSTIAGHGRGGMILNIVVGEPDSLSNPMQILETVEGLAIDVRSLWLTFEAKIEGTIGPCPQRPFRASPAEGLEWERLLKLWQRNRDSLHRTLKETWGIPQETKDYLNTRYFVEFLIKHYNFRRVETGELFTENF